jgi:hypothetical protein
LTVIRRMCGWMDETQSRWRNVDMTASRTAVCRHGAAPFVRERAGRRCTDTAQVASDDRTHLQGQAVFSAASTTSENSTITNAVHAPLWSEYRLWHSAPFHVNHAISISRSLR